MMAVVLVGGEGTRLRPLTWTVPKSLLPICNQPFLERQIAWLASHGVDEVVLSMGYLPDAFHERFPGDVCAGVPLRYAVESEPLGTGGAIRFAADGVSERFVVCNGDVLTDLDLGGMIDFHEERGAEATIALTQVDDPSRFGVVPTTAEGRVIAFVEKPPPGQAPTDWINAGTYVLEPSMLDRIPSGVTVSVERETFPRTLETGGALYAVQSDAYWLDIGVPRQFLDAHFDVLKGRIGGPPVESTVLLGPGARVEDGADVEWAVLGPDALVEVGATVTRSVLMEGAVVEAGAMVAESIIGPRAVVGPGATLSELTVVGEGVEVEGGTSMAGARLDPAGVAPEPERLPGAGNTAQ